MIIDIKWSTKSNLRPLHCLSDIRSHVTITTKTFLRYPQLKVLLSSIRSFYSNIEVIIADDNFEPEHIKGEHIKQYIMPPAQVYTHAVTYYDNTYAHT